MSGETFSKLILYLGERDRDADGKILAGALLDCLQRHGVRTAVVLRGVEGFGLKHHRQSSALLTLSEDLPLVILAVDRESRISPALLEIRELMTEGLIATGPGGTAGDQIKAEAVSLRLTLILRRSQRIESRPGYVTAVELLHRFGVEGVTVMLGIDGLLAGHRRRARFLSGNRDVPLLVTAIGEAGKIETAVEQLNHLLPDPQILIEPLRILKRDGREIEAFERSSTDDSGSTSQKLTIYSGEQSRHAGRPLYAELVRRLREVGAPGATSLRGILGYHGDHRPHGDRLLSIRRRVPVVTQVVDTSDRIGRWQEIIDELTDETGLVTIEHANCIYPHSAPG